MYLFKAQKQFKTTSVIYKITCVNTQQVYVGSTISFRKRMKEHKQNLIGNKHHSFKFQNAFNKYGKNAFVVEILEDFNRTIPFLSLDYKEVLLKREEYWIKQLNPELNIQRLPYSNYGKLAEPIPVYQYDLDGNFIKEWKSQAEAGLEYGSIQGAFTHQSAHGYQWSKVKVDKMPKYKRQSGSKARKKCTLYDLWGTKIKTYNSKRDLMEDLYHERNNRITQLLVKCITRGGVLQNKYLVAEGDAEKYDFTLHLQREKTRIIVEYDQEGNEINRFATLTEAQRYYGISVAKYKTDTETIYTWKTKTFKKL